ncbi:hypothetical protein LDL59_11590 [Kaistella anthropi]|nr:hypothetical protein [Kaistella anthropi]
MNRQGCNVTGIIIKGSLAPAQDGNISFEALQKFGKTVNFARGTIKEFVGVKSSGDFFVAIS